MSENFERDHHHPHHRPQPRPCSACGSSNVEADRQGDVLVITCKDCGHVEQKTLPPRPHHGEEA